MIAEYRKEASRVGEGACNADGDRSISCGSESTVNMGVVPSALVNPDFSDMTGRFHLLPVSATSQYWFTS